MIIGLSEVRRLPRLGKIHLGVKEINAKGVEYPKAVNYFVVPPEVAEVYGEKPTELDIVIPTEDPNIFFPLFNFFECGDTSHLLTALTPPPIYEYAWGGIENFART